MRFCDGAGRLLLVACLLGWPTAAGRQPLCTVYRVLCTPYLVASYLSLVSCRLSLVLNAQSSWP